MNTFFAVVIIGQVHILINISIKKSELKSKHDMRNQTIGSRTINLFEKTTLSLIDLFDTIIIFVSNYHKFVI